MQIRIVPSRVFFSSKYKIFVDGKELYYTSTESLNHSHFKLHEIETGITKSILTHEASLLRDSFNIRLFNPDNVSLPFKRKKQFDLKYFGDYNGDTYEIFFFSNYSALLYKNDNEIMIHTKERNSFSFTRDYVFNFNDTENTHLELLVTLCLFITVKESTADN